MLLHEYSKPINFYELLVRGLTLEEKELYLVTCNKVRKTKAIVSDYNKEGEVVFTLKDCRPSYYNVTANGLIVYDLRQLYLGVDDITEFKFIDKFMYDKHQWEKIAESFEFKDQVKSWRDEQRLKVKSDMFNILLDDANDKASKTKTQSAKYLLEKYYDPKTSDNQQTRKEKQEDKQILVSDHQRILESFNTKVN